MERRAAGQPLFTIPLSQLSTANLPPRDTADASALSNMMRNLGGSVGIALLSTVIDRREHFHFSILAEAMTQNAARTQERIAMLMAEARGAIADPAIAKAQALMSVAAGVRREAYVSAYSDAFWIVGVGLIISLCAIVLLRKSRPPKGPVEAHWSKSARDLNLCEKFPLINLASGCKYRFEITQYVVAKLMTARQAERSAVVPRPHFGG